MRNPNGYGTVARLSGNRRRPFIVKKVADWKENGQPIYCIIGYAETREAGNMLLAEYNRDPWDVDRAKMTLQQLFGKKRKLRNWANQTRSPFGRRSNTVQRWRRSLTSRSSRSICRTP